MTLLVAGTVTAVSGQTRERFYSEKGDNYFISLGVGIQATMNPDNFDYGIGKAIMPQVTLSAGRWFTPVLGVRGQIAGWATKLNTNYNNGTTDASGNFTGYGEYREYTKNYIGAYLDGMVNLSHWWGGYRSDRLFNVSAFIGPGLTFARGFGSQAIDNSTPGRWERIVDDGSIKALISGSVGLMGQFNVSKCIDINIEARGVVSPSVFGKLSNAYTDGSVALTAGITYTFGGKKFSNCATKGEDLSGDLLRYKKALEDAEARLAKQPQVVEKEVIREVVKEVPVAGPRAIFFQIGKSVIDDYGKVNIQLAAKVIKANPGKKYKIAGYADKATGSAKLNQKLSEARAKAVYDALIQEGVSASQLEMAANGGTDNMFGKDKLNRVVIME